MDIVDDYEMNCFICSQRVKTCPVSNIQYPSKFRSVPNSNDISILSGFDRCDRIKPRSVILF